MKVVRGVERLLRALSEAGWRPKAKPVTIDAEEQREGVAA